jgi:hypothetical protein
MPNTDVCLAWTTIELGETQLEWLLFPMGRERAEELWEHGVRYGQIKPYAEKHIVTREGMRSLFIKQGNAWAIADKKASEIFKASPCAA